MFRRVPDPAHRLKSYLACENRNKIIIAVIVWLTGLAFVLFLLAAAITALPTSELETHWTEQGTLLQPDDVRFSVRQTDGSVVKLLLRCKKEKKKAAVAPFHSADSSTYPRPFPSKQTLVVSARGSNRRSSHRDQRAGPGCHAGGAGLLNRS